MWTVPDKGTVPADAQSILFQAYLDVLSIGVAGDSYVLAGCAVTGNGDMAPAVSTGSVWTAETTFSIPGGTVILAAADPTNPRFDLVAVDATGSLVVRTGTPAVNPKPQALTDDDVVLAVVYVAAAATSITSAQCTDLRVFRSELQEINSRLATAEDQEQSDTDVLRRDFRMLLKDYFFTFKRIPPGLENEIPNALAAT